MFDKNARLDIPCPECGHKTSMAVREIECNPTYGCAGCGKNVTVDASQFKDGLKDAEKQINDMVKDLQRMFR